MMYQVTAYFSEIFEVEAENESEAINKASQQIKNINTIPIPVEYDVECLEKE